MLKKIIKQIIPDHLEWALRYYRHPKKFAVVGGPLTYAKDGLATAHNSSSLQSPEFRKAYDLARSTGSFQGSWGQVDPEYRTYIYCWAAYHSRHLDGDWVECGVNKGGMARAAIEYAGFSKSSPRQFYLLDTYQGTPDQYFDQAEANNRYEECYQQVKNNFKEFPNVVIVKGEVPGTLQQVSSKKIAFLSIDMNCVEPEIEALHFFWPKMPTGGVVVLDDYNNIGHEKQKAAHDQFASEQGLKVMSLPTGQGLLFKV